jgi:hypothetical protein
MLPSILAILGDLPQRLLAGNHCWDHTFRVQKISTIARFAAWLTEEMVSAIPVQFHEEWGWIGLELS